MEILTGVHSLRQDKGGHVHAFLLDDGQELTLIDTLFDNDGQIVLDAIREIGRDVLDLKHIVLTHAHRSHLGGLAALQHVSGATVYAHEWEADIIGGQRRAQAVVYRPMRPLAVWWPTYPLQLGLNLGVGPHQPCSVDHHVSDGDRIGPLHVLHAPGHSPGHLAFHWPERRMLFAGDAIATWPVFSPGWPTFNLNPIEHYASLRRLADFDAQAIAVGHGEPIATRGAERLQEMVSKLP